MNKDVGDRVLGVTTEKACCDEVDTDAILMAHAPRGSKGVKAEGHMVEEKMGRGVRDRGEIIRDRSEEGDRWKRRRGDLAFAEKMMNLGSTGRKGVIKVDIIDEDFVNLGA